MGSYHLHIIDGSIGVLHHLTDGGYHYVPVGGMDDVDGRPNNKNELVRNSGDDVVLSSLNIIRRGKHQQSRYHC